MSVIKKSNLISELVSETNMTKLTEAAEKAAARYRLDFKIMATDSQSVTIQAGQAKVIEQDRKTDEEITAITEKVFAKYFKGMVVNVLPVPFEDHPIAKIDAGWIAEKMKATGIKAKDIVSDTGLQKATISNWVSGRKPLTQIAKALFYFYFKTS